MEKIEAWSSDHTVGSPIRFVNSPLHAIGQEVRRLTHEGECERITCLQKWPPSCGASVSWRKTTFCPSARLNPLENLFCWFCTHSFSISTFGTFWILPRTRSKLKALQTTGAPSTKAACWRVLRLVTVAMDGTRLWSWYHFGRGVKHCK